MEKLSLNVVLLGPFVGIAKNISMLYKLKQYFIGQLYHSYAH